ncbi:hypothetical protein Lal_00039798 [Lupinus albus]|nr:hypothetical protein Lal_00039798 [Lupinus albus]
MSFTSVSDFGFDRVAYFPEQLADLLSDVARLLPSGLRCDVTRSLILLLNRKFFSWWMVDTSKHTMWYHYEHSDNAWKLQSANMKNNGSLNKLEKCAAIFRPKLIVDGANAYACLYDYARIRKKTVLLPDIAHISGLVIVGVIPYPIDYADVVTTTTRKSLCGPHGSMIFFRKGVKEINKQRQEANDDASVSDTPLDARGSSGATNI